MKILKIFLMGIIIWDLTNSLINMIDQPEKKERIAALVSFVIEALFMVYFIWGTR